MVVQAQGRLADSKTVRRVSPQHGNTRNYMKINVILQLHIIDRTLLAESKRRSRGLCPLKKEHIFES